MNQMLRPQAMRQLTDALDHAVTTNPALATARQILLQPLKMLEAFGQEVSEALANHPAALERLRLLLQLSAGTALETKRAFESSSGPTGQAHHGRPCEGSVIRMGSLVIAGLAAGRVGRRMNDVLAEQMVDVIHGVALAASPAESLARSLQSGLSVEQVATALEALAGGDRALTRISAMAPVFLDACERARWDCLGHVFETVKKQVLLDWEGSDSAAVVEVQRAKRSAQSALVIHLAKGDDTNGLLTALEKKEALCVLASARGSLAVAASHVDRKTLVVTVPLVPQARSGCVGFATEERRASAIATRRQVVKYWDGQAKTHCLREAHVPTEVLAPLDDDAVYAPTPTSNASWGVRIIDAHVVREARVFSLTVSLTRAEEAARVVARIDGLIQPLTLEIDGSEASVALPESLAKGEVKGTVTAYAKHRDDPDDERLVYSAAPVASRGAVSTKGEVGSGDDSHPDGSNHRLRYVAVVRPVFVLGDRIERVSADSIPHLQKTLCRVAVVEELPFISDEDLIVQGTLGDLHSPSAAALMERLAALAARVSGLEDATLMALVPEQVAGEKKAFFAAPSDGVTALVLATPGGPESGIVPVITPLPIKSDRLRLVGRIFRDDIAVTEPVQVTARAAGPGAPFLTPFVAVALDDIGEARVAVRIRVMNATRSGPFAVLLPVSDDVVSVELRYQPETLAVELRAQPESVFANLASIDGPVLTKPLNTTAMIAPMPAFGRPMRGPLPVLSRPTGTPTVAIAELTPAHVRWNASHSRGIRPQIEVEVGRTRGDGGVVWTRLARLAAGASTDEADLGLERPLPGPGIEQLRVVASDGWNSALGSHALAVRPGPLRIRALGDDRYWLDLAQPHSGSIIWEVWNADVFASRSSGVPVVRLSTAGAASSGGAAPLRTETLDVSRIFALDGGESAVVVVARWGRDEDALSVPVRT
jgi:hypothetical protein